MLDTFEILTTSGVVLWSRTYVPVGTNVINSLIRDVFIEERIQPQADDAGSKPAYKKDGYTLKWTAAKDVGLIFVAVYQSLVHLTWIDKLLDNVRALFIGLYGDKLQSDSSVVNCDKFGSYFDRQMHELEGASDSGAPSIKLTTPESSTDNDSADDTAIKPAGLQKPQRPLYDTSADSTPVPTPDTSRPTTPAQSQLLTGKARPIGGKMSRRDKKKASAFSSAPVSSGDEASAKKKGKGSAKKGRVWGEFGAEEEDDSILDYSQSDVQGNASGNETLEEIKQETWGRKTNKGEFVLKDLDDEMDAIIAAQNAKRDKDTPAAAGGLVGSSLGAIGGLFRNVVGGKTLTKEDLAKPLKGMEEHLLRKNVAREAAVRLCESVERDLVGIKTPSFTTIETTIKSSMEKALTKILTPTSSLDLLREIQHTNSTTTRPYVLSIVGVNGVGKSTNLSKIAFFLLQNHHRVLIAAADTFRSGAVEQLRVHVDRLKELSQREGGHVDLFEKGYGKDAANIAADAVTFATKNNFNVVLIDTAGRRHNDQRLMSSLEKFGKLANPDKILMVGEALVGTDSVAQARNFNASFGPGRNLDGFVISKCDTVGDMCLLTILFSEKTPPAGQGFLGWVKKFTNLSDEYVLNHHSLDAYLYLRFLKVLTLMAFVGAIITWPVLFPVNATGGGGESGLDILSFSNVENEVHYFAHALIAWVFFGWVLFLIGREMLYLVKLRKAYCLTTWNASRISQRTVLFTDVPQESLSLEELHTMFPRVSQIWLVPNVIDLDDDVSDLDKAVIKLEAGETKFMQKVTKQQQKKGIEKETHDEALRPTHKTKLLIGKKVDSIDYFRNQIKELLPKIQTAQRSHLAGKEKLDSAVFIEFDTILAAETAFNANQHRRPTKFSSRQMGVLPEEVIWKNLNMGSKSRSLRHLIATIFISAMILFWSIPVAVVGSISNINYLTENVPFLSFINKIPEVILGVVTGLLPVVALAILMALVPVICRVVAKLAGAVTISQVEQQTQKWYFAFQVIQVFLITTFTSAAAAVASQIVSDPTSAVSLLSKNLPKASNFYISYFILFGLAISSKYLFNIGGLVGVFVLSKFAKTPRKKYNRYVALSEPSWGAEYPKWTNLGVIAICYATIAPLVLGFAAVGIGMIYVAFRYNMMYVHDTHIDTKGGFYARALEQLMVGVYLGELCLLGLFGIGIGGSITSVGPTVLQMVLIVATVIFHVFMKRKIKQLNLLEDFEHSGQQSNAEAGHLSATNRMSPGYKKDGIRSDQALVSRYNNEQRAIKGSEAAGIAPPADAPLQRSLLKRIFSPHTLSASDISASLATRFCRPVPPYTENEVLEAYLHPALAERQDVIWLPRDRPGVSKHEVAELQENLGTFGTRVTDEGAIMNEKGKVEWDVDSVRKAPLWKHRVVY
ncbi:hypothetical protein COCSADRAFT_77360 [Bipolaris sorokiniana ND90Pr]|uniref:Signal recognition particle receptor subunit alpha homolog n=1 Tax=Cochliobolus sativus (strain ND90Pr / ATCC 201652) TaxID=665912 RepID=M2SP59_COCSN|nr:uncharacterized protein COCSADRAFT_77360 [Bipolaris sorokiniana ND90Pr]EMD68988.1 hypothetical protein COCSADRAFT_77360 [Bipolaris sorokiniana ND90Pr]